MQAHKLYVFYSSKSKFNEYMDALRCLVNLTSRTQVKSNHTLVYCRVEANTWYCKLLNYSCV